jgi:adenylosuccinate synthase
MADITIIAGLGFGDEGKGSTVDWLTRHHGSKLVVRYNGGAQAGHNVVLPDGRHHTFSQWGSGTFAGAETLLSRHMMINPIFAKQEARHLERCGISNPLGMLYVEHGALVTTPFHVAANRIHELARSKDGGVHGTCGMGIGETMADKVAGHDDVILAMTIKDPVLLRQRLKRCQERKLREIQFLEFDKASPTGSRELEILTNPAIVDEVAEEYEMFAAAVTLVDDHWLMDRLSMSDEHVIFEGAQGVLLDEWFGFHPHTTYSTCTFQNATDLIDFADVERVRRLGVLRVFHTRHGEGPFPTQEEGYDAWTKDDHNGFATWQHDFRAGPFDMVLARYALDVIGGVDGLAFTHVDKLHDRQEVPVCWGYDWKPGRVAQRLLKKHVIADLEYQEKLGQLVRNSKPLCNRVKVGGEHAAMLHALSLGEALNTPVALISKGQTWKDKTMVQHHLEREPAQIPQGFEASP